MTNPLVGISNGGLSIIDPTVAEKLANKKISPSLVTGLQGCAASWLANTFVIREIMPEEDDNAASRGSLFHKVMEETFAEEPELRTRERINEHRDAVLETDEFKAFKGNEDALRWLEEAIDGYYKMGGRPEKVKVATIKRESDKYPKKGLEIFVRGNIGGTKRDTLGFVDRLTEDQSPDAPEDGIIIEDWKSGAKAKKWNPKTKSDEGKAEARQQTIYSMLLEKEGINVTGARLIFPVAGSVVNVDINDEKFREQVIKDIQDTDAALDNYIETNLFEYKPSFLCSWCPISKICPKAQIGKFDKARAAYAKQPSMEKLAEGIEFI